MPSQSPFRIELTKDEHAILGEASRSSHRSLLGGGARQDRAFGRRREPPTRKSPPRLDTTPQTACKWRKRFYEEGSRGLEEQASLRQTASLSPPEARMEVKALACELPATYRGSSRAAGAPGKWRGKRSIGALWPESRVAPSGAGSPRMPSAPTTTACGSSRAIPPSPRKPGGCSTSTRAVGGEAVGAGGLRPQRRREDQHPGARAPPSHRARRGRRPCRSSTSTTPGRAGLPGRLGRPAGGSSVAASPHRHRALWPPGRAGDGAGALPLGRAGLLDRG